MQGGMGVVLKITVTAALTVVANLLDVEFPKFKKFIDEATGHDSAGGWYEAVATGKFKLEGFKATLGWDAAEATHAAIVAAFNSLDPLEATIEDPAGGEVITFNTFIEEIQRLAAQESRYSAEVVFHPTGAPTIA